MENSKKEVTKIADAILKEIKKKLNEKTQNIRHTRYKKNIKTNK